MFTKEEQDLMKVDGFSFEEIQELEKRMIAHNNGTAEYIDEDTFWKEVHKSINVKMKKQNV